MRTLCRLIVALSAIEFLIATVGVQIRELPRRTDFASYYLAGSLALERHNPYDAPAFIARGYEIGFDHEQYPYLYPPPFAWLMQPLARLPYERARQVWMLLSTAALFVALGWMAPLLNGLARAWQLESRADLELLYTAFVVTVLNTTSVHNDIRSGSVGCFLLLFFVWWSWSATRQQRLAGVWAWGATFLAKLTPVVLLPYVLWRGGARSWWGVAVVVGLTLAVSASFWGGDIFRQYVDDALLPALHTDVAWAHNVSLHGYLSRLLTRSDEVPGLFDAPFLKQLLTLGGSLLIVVISGWCVFRERRPATFASLEIGCLVLALLVVMRITWVHTTTAMLFVWPIIMLRLMRRTANGTLAAQRLGLVACGGYFLAAAHFPILWAPRFQEGVGVLATGVHLAGLLILWSVCVILLGRSRDLPDSRPNRGTSLA